MGGLCVWSDVKLVVWVKKVSTLSIFQQFLNFCSDIFVKENFWNYSTHGSWPF